MPTTPLPAARESAESTARHGGFLPHVQALRALAVVVVVAYHLFPHQLPGGYIGVDVFFVISGFLISSHLIAGLQRRPRLRFRDFYARRVRRLLPASLLVLAVSAVLTVLLLPQSVWGASGTQILASSFYVQNWALAAQAVDYLGGSISSPVQHYWSLSLEEQFYVLWPLILLGLIVLGARGGPRRVLTIGIAGVTLASFAFSVVFTTTDPGAAYFITPTRIWEFGVGALATLVPVAAVRSRLVRILLAWVSLLAIVVACVLFTSATPFPGWAAAFPVLGAAGAILFGGEQARWAPSIIGRLRPVQFLGDTSYSIYLWHFPVILFLPAVLHTVALSIPAKLVAGGLAVALGWLSYRFVENRFRGVKERPDRPVRDPRLRTVIAVTLTAMLVIGGSGVAISATYGQLRSQAEKRLAAFVSSAPTCAGAAAFDPNSVGCGTKVSGEPFPDPILGNTSAVGQGCQQTSTRSEVLSCHYGTSAASGMRVALVGDSHANQWVSALDGAASRRGWSLDVFAKSNCALNVNADHHFSCEQWNAAVQRKLIAGHYDLVVVSAAARGEFAGGTAGAVAGYATSWSRLTRAGIQVVAIKDTPWPREVGIEDEPSCVQSRGAAACALPQDKAFPPDPLVAATKKANVPLVDLTDYFCADGVCPAVAGSELVYRDGDHMTALYSGTLAPYLGQKLDSVVKGSAK